MIVYHGSNSNFRTLRISKNLVNHKSTITNEGLGIYFSTNLDVAKSYGKYIYTLEINDKVLIDFRSRGNCRRYLAKLAQYIYKNTNVDILDYFSLADLSERLYWGNQAISSIGREISLLLDSDERWYKSLSETKREKIFRILRNYGKRNLKAYMFTYEIKNIGVIKDVSEDVVKIVSKECINIKR